MLNEPMTRPLYVIFAGQEMNARFLFSALKQKATLSDDESAILFQIYVQLLQTLDCFPACTDSFLGELCEFMSVKCPERILNSDSSFEVPAIYSHLFFKHRFLREKSNAISFFPDPTDFLAKCYELCTHSATSRTAIALVDAIFSTVTPPWDVLHKAPAALIQATLHDYNAAHHVLQTRLWAYVPESQKMREMLEKDLRSYCVTLLPIVTRPFRRIAVAGLRFFEKHHNVKYFTHEFVTDILKQIPQALVQSDKGYALRFAFSGSCPLKGIPEPLALLQTIFEQFKVLIVSPIPKSIYQAVKNGSYNDQGVLQYSSFRFAIKMMAKLFLIVPADSHASSLWEQFLRHLHQERSRWAIPFFRRCFEKQQVAACPSLPKDNLNIFSTPNRLPPLPCCLDDILLVRFFYQYSTCRPTKDLVQWLSTALRALSHAQQRPPVMQVAENLLLFLKELHILFDKLDIRDCVISAIDVALAPQLGIAPFSFPLHIIAEEIPDLVLQLFLQHLTKSWSAEYLVYLLVLLRSPASPQFRGHTLRRVIPNVKSVFTALAKLPKYDRAFAMSAFLTSSTYALASLDEESLDVGPFYDLCLQVFQFVEQDHDESLRFQPALQRGFAAIFLPMKFVHLFRTGFPLFLTLRDRAIVAIFRAPRLFFTVSFTRRFLIFLRALGEPSASEIVKEISVFPASTAHEFAFLFYFLSEFSRFFDACAMPQHFSGLPSCSAFEGAALLATIGQFSLRNESILDSITDQSLLQLSRTLHSAAITQGRLTVSSCRTACHLIAVLPPPAGYAADFATVLSEYCVFMPYSAMNGPRLFRAISQSASWLDPREPNVRNFVFGILSCHADIPANTFAIWIATTTPGVFRWLKDRAPPARLLQIALGMVRNFLKANPQELGAASGLVPILMDMREVRLHDPGLWSDIRRLFSEWARKDGEKEVALPSSTRKCMLELLTALARDMVAVPFLPIPFQAQSVEPMLMVKDFAPIIRECVQAISLSGGFEMTRLMIDAVFRALKPKHEKLSEPLETPIATIAQWYWEILPTSREYPALETCLAAFKPMTDSEMVWALSTFRAPIHPVIADFLRNYIRASFPHLISRAARSPAVCPIFVTTGSDLLNDCWRFDWFAASPASHLEVFVRLALPPRISPLLISATAHDLSELAVSAIRSLTDRRFRGFFDFYSALFPTSSLSACLWASPLLPAIFPLHHSSLTANQNYLNTRNFCEDWLGLLKIHAPALSGAASLHQLSNYRAASAFYSPVICNTPEAYFLGLSELRLCSLNLSIATATSAYSHLMHAVRDQSHAPVPFLSSSREAHPDFTPALSQVHLDWLMRATFSEEFHNTTKAVQQRTSRSVRLSDLLRQWAPSLTRSLDRLTGLASTLMWRLAGLAELPAIIDTVSISRQESDASIRDATRRNHALLCRVLFRSGATSRAIRLLGRGGPGLAKLFSVTPRTLPPLHAVAQAPAGPSWLRQSTFALLKDFTQCVQVTPSQWLSTFLEAAALPELAFDGDALFHRIHDEIGRATVDRCHFVLALCVRLLRASPSLVPQFEEHVLNHAKDDYRGILLKWLLPLVRTCGRLPDDFLSSLLKFAPSQFFLHAQHAHCMGERALDEFIAKARIQKEIGRSLSDNEAAFRWVSENYDDVRRLADLVRAHGTLFKLLPKAGVDVAELRGLAQTCGLHRPVFRVQPPSQNSGFRFPGGFYHAVFVALETRRDSEAVLRVILSRGDTRTFLIVSPRLHTFSAEEGLFISAIARFIENHPASRTRSRFLSYPNTFLLNPDLMLLGIANGRTQTTLAASETLEALSEARLRVDDFDGSPAAIKSARGKRDVDWLSSFFIPLTAGSKVSFFFERQSFAAHLAAFAYLRFLFGVGLPRIPAIELFGDRLRTVLPGFFQTRQRVPQMPLTPSVRTFLPRYVVRGSFETTFLVMADAVGRHRGRVKVVLEALWPEDKWQEGVTAVMERADKMAPAMAEEGDKTDEPWSSTLSEHLVETAGDSLAGTKYTFGWL
jgi:hypothetical protein